MADTSTVQEKIALECDRVKALLLDKNRRYGNAALAPVGVFSRLAAKYLGKDPAEVPPWIGVFYRIDDKLSRLVAAEPGETEDPITDLIGYLILLKVGMDGKGTKV